MGGRIRLRLDEIGRGQKWLADATKVSLAAINALVRRDSKRSQFAGEISAALGVTDLWLLSGRGAKLRSPGAASMSDAGETRKLSAAERKLLKLWQPLFEEQRELLMKEIHAANTRALATWAEMKRRGYVSHAPENALPPEFTREAQRELPMGPSEAPRPAKRRR